MAAREPALPRRCARLPGLARRPATARAARRRPRSGLQHGAPHADLRAAPRHRASTPSTCASRAPARYRCFPGWCRSNRRRRRGRRSTWCSASTPGWSWRWWSQPCSAR
ncbi:MAG: hypothetical protein MZW92_07160 [Comamonadaceae bacterium]|nr:hypothetical protein [Comamonadaceae bacterium]